MSPAEPVAIADTILCRIRGEYLEMPGLRLTPAQAQRLWTMDRPTCESVLNALVNARFLTRTRDGAFVLASAHG